MRQYETISLNGVGRANPELARELLKVDRFLQQVSHAMTTNAIAEGQEPSAVATGASVNMTVKEAGTSVSDKVGALDFGAGFDITESPTGEANIVLDFSEKKPDHGTELGGLGDDDHTQYTLAAGTRAFTGDQSMGGFDLTNIDILRGQAASTLTLESDDTEGGSGEGFRFNWNAGAATSDGDVIASFGVDEGSGYVTKAVVKDSVLGSIDVLADSGSGTFRAGFGYGLTALGRVDTGIICSSSILRLRVNGNNAFEIQGSLLNDLATGTPFTFQTRMAAGNAGPRFRLIVAAGDEATTGEFFTLENPQNTNKFQVDYNGDTTMAGFCKIAGDLDHDGSNVGFYGVAPAARSTGWAMSNVTTDKVMNANSTTLNELADVVATLVDQMKTYGLLGA